MRNLVMKIFLIILISLSSVSVGICDKIRPITQVVETIYEFGEFEVVKIIPITSDYTIKLFKENVLLTTFIDASFNHISASKNNEVFIGISNTGEPGTAFIIFNSKGDLLVEVKHDLDRHHYCHMSIWYTRIWYDNDNPGIRFVYTEDDEFKDIVVNGCNGKEIKIIENIVMGEKNESFPDTAN